MPLIRVEERRCRAEPLADPERVTPRGLAAVVDRPGDLGRYRSTSDRSP